MYASLPFFTNRAKESLVIVGTIVMFLFLLADGGIAKTGIYWVSFFPFLLFGVSGVRRGWKWLALFLVGFLAIQILDMLDVIHTPYSYQETLYFFFSFVFYVFIAVFFEVLRIKQQYELEQQNESLVATREQLHQTLASLEKEVMLRTAELKESNEKLAHEVEEHIHTNTHLKEAEQKFFQAQKMEALGTLVSGIAHDFNSIMSGISAHVFLIQREIKGNDLVQGKLDDVEKLVFRANDMSKQLLTFSRKDKVDKKVFNMRSFFNEAMKLGSISLPSRIKIHKQITDLPLPVCASVAQLQQVLMNLLNNAKDALEQTECPRIQLNLCTLDEAKSLRSNHPKLKGEWVYMRVSDNGQGIPQHDLVHVFDPFFTTKASKKATGLGLAMCYGAIKSHQGMVEVESEEGKGTAFHIYLPQANQRVIKTKQTFDESLQGRGETILLADEDKSLRTAHKNVLEKLNYKVLVAEDGLEAIKLYAEHEEEIDLVIIDILMPKMSGMKAAEHMFMMNKRAKVLFTSRYDSDTTTKRVLLDGNKQIDAVTRLCKPFTIEQMCQMIRKEIDHYHEPEIAKS